MHAGLSHLVHAFLVSICSYVHANIHVYISEAEAVHSLAWPSRDAVSFRSCMRILVWARLFVVLLLLLLLRSIPRPRWEILLQIPGRRKKGRKKQ